MPQPIESLDRSALERRYRKMRLATVIVSVVALALGAALFAQGMPGAAQGSQASSQGTESDPAGAAGGGSADSCPVTDRRDADDPRALGDVDAPVVLHEWTDFRCPYCASFSRDTLPVLIEEYVETGKVRLEIHDAALVGGENSVLIAQASRAAGAQGKYFEFYDQVYHAPDSAKDANGELNLAALEGFARAAGVPDMAAFTASVTSGEFEDAVRKDTAEAQSIGVTGVPFFATSGCGKVLSGAQPVDTFRAELDAAVEAARAEGK